MNINILNMAYTLQLADFSKDESTKVSATLFNGIIPIEQGYNGFPRGMTDDDASLNQRPEKYIWVSHAEQNLFFNLARQHLKKDSIMLTQNFPDMAGARAIVQSGIKTVVFLNDIDVEYKDRVLRLFDVCNISCHDMNDIENNRYKQKLSKFMNQVVFHGEYYSTDDNKSASMIIDPESWIPNGIGANKMIENISLGSEKDALLNLIQRNRKMSDSDMYVSLFPCSVCASMIACSDIRRVHVPELDFEKEVDKRWQKEFDLANKIFSSYGVEIDQIPMESIMDQANKMKKKSLMKP